MSSKLDIWFPLSKQVNKHYDTDLTPYLTISKKVCYKIKMQNKEVKK